jgi:cytochrome c oxidase subunit 2
MRDTLFPALVAGSHEASIRPFVEFSSFFRLTIVMWFSMMYRLLGLVAFLLAVSAAPAFAAENVYGQPVEWQLNFQNGVTPVMHEVVKFHDLLLVIIFATSAFVMVLLAYVAIRYNAKANPKPATFSHNTTIEILWTAIPVIILLIIVVPSMRLLYFADHVEEADMTLKVVGYQWYWGYEYPDQGISFESRIKPDADLLPGEPRLLAVDNKVVLPVDTTIRVIMTGADVIHAWAVPAFGVKTDAVPGRANESWFRIERPGVYYGQCSELCGVDHGFMPIAVEAVSKEQFAAWVAKQKGEPEQPAEAEQPAAEQPETSEQSVKPEQPAQPEQSN